MIHRRAFYLLFSGIGFFLGVICFKAIDNGAISFDPQISFGDVSSAVTTLFVAILVTSYLERRSQSDRSEKDLLLQKLERVSEALREFENFKDGGALTELTGSLKRLAMASSSVHNILRELKYPTEAIESASFEPIVREIRKLATDTPIKRIESHAKRARCHASVKEGIISLATERKELLEGKIAEMHSRIIKAQIVLNRI